MKKNLHFDKRIIIIIVLSLIIVVGAFITTSRGLSQSILLPPQRTSIPVPSPVRPAGCVPLPQNEPNTKNMTNEILPSVTPIPFMHKYDLSPDIDPKDKWEATVYRCDGSFDKYLGGVNINSQFSIPLGPGDIIINSAPPASMMGQQSPRYSDITPQPKGTNPPYPAP
jgi:hypothetical protein